MLNSAVIYKFNEFKKASKKYEDLNIEDIEFDLKKLHEVSTITPGQSPEGINLNTEGNGLPFYQGKTEFTDMYIGKPTKWTKHSKKTANKDDILISMRAPAGAVNIAIETISIGRGLSAIRANDDILNDYLFRYLKSIETRINLEKNNGGFYSSMTKDELYDFDIYVPKQINDKYTSQKIQTALVEFLNYQKSQTELLKGKMSSLQSKVDKADKAILNKIFEMQDSFIVDQFNRWAALKSYTINANDIEFEIKRIHSDNQAETVCIKRMGFTPTRDPAGNINWFTVADLNTVEGIYIDQPDTKEKTTMALIRQAVDKKNTGKSEKLNPIQKGDILISFKLTVGVVKIYNSDLPGYCNEAIDILTVKDGFYNEYIAYNCMLEYPKYGTQTNNGMTLNDESKKEINIYVPKPTNDYSSLELQKIIVEFIGAFNLWKNKIMDLSSSVQNKCNKLDDAFLTEIFKGSKND